MFDLVLDAFRWLIAFFRSRNSLGLEIIALRQQLGVLERKNSQPRLGRLDRLFGYCSGKSGRAGQRFWL
jgi:hypothetical protein